MTALGARASTRTSDSRDDGLSGVARNPDGIQSETGLMSQLITQGCAANASWLRLSSSI